MNCMDRRTRCRMLPLYNREPVRRTSLRAPHKVAKAQRITHAARAENHPTCGHDNPCAWVMRDVDGEKEPGRGCRVKGARQSRKVVPGLGVTKRQENSVQGGSVSGAGLQRGQGVLLSMQGFSDMPPSYKYPQSSQTGQVPPGSVLSGLVRMASAH